MKLDVRALTVGMIVKGNGKIIVSGSSGDSYSKILGSGNIFSENLDSFSHTVSHLSDLLAIRPELVACDLHPDYLSSRFAGDSGLPGGVDDTREKLWGLLSLGSLLLTLAAFWELFLRVVLRKA